MKRKYFWSFFVLAFMFIFASPTMVNAEETAMDVATKDEFIAAVQNENINVINLVSDMDLTGSGVIDIDNRTLNLNGHTIESVNFSLIFEGSNFIIKNGKFKVIEGNELSYALFIGDEITSDNVLIENITTEGGINIYNSTNVVLKNVDVTGFKYYAIWCDWNAHVVIESGNFKTTELSTALLGMTLLGTDLNINGGTFKSNTKPLVLTSKNPDGSDAFNKPIINGGTFDAPFNEYLADGYETIDNGDGTFSVSKTSPEVVEKPVEDTSNNSSDYTVKVTYVNNDVKTVPNINVNTINNTDDTDEFDVNNDDEMKTIDKTDKSSIASTHGEDTASFSWWWILLILLGIAIIIIFIIKKRKNEKNKNL